MDLPKETSLRLFEQGGTIVFLDVPVGTEVGIDMESWNTGEKFRGIKMIPPGVHFVYFSTVGRDGHSQSPRTGFFHEFKKGEIICKKYDPRTEDLSSHEASEEDITCLRSNLQELDKFLGPYPYSLWRKWVSLTNRITRHTIVGLAPIGGRICSAPELYLVEGNEASAYPSTSTSGNLSRRMTKLELAESRLPKMSESDSSRIRYTVIPSHLYDSSTTPSEVTLQNMDWSSKLEHVLNSCGSPAEFLAEFQFAFICFLVGQNLTSFEHWKDLIQLICHSYSAITSCPDLFTDFISDLYFQIGEVEAEIFTDIVTENNFIYSCLKRLFENITETDGINSRLEGKAYRFKNFLIGKLNWEFPDVEDEENKPVIVS